MTIALFKLLLPFLVSLAAVADFPATLTVDGRLLNRLGKGSRRATFFKVKVYDAALYAEKSDFGLEDDTLKVIKMEFVRSVSAQDTREVWQDSLKKSCGKNCSLDFKPFLNEVRAIKKGDRHAYAFYRDKTFVDQAGVVTEYHQPGFSFVLLSTWIGDHPPTQDLKKDLLKGHLLKAHQ